MAVALVRGGEGVRIEFTSPVFGPDAEAAYLLQYHRRSTAKDTFNIAVDPSTGLLTSLTGEADDQGPKIIEELGKLAGALAKPEHALETGKQVLYEAVFDPAENKEVEAVKHGLNAALNGPLVAALDHDCTDTVDAALRAANLKTQKARDDRKLELRASTPVCIARAKFVPTTIWVEVA